MATYRRLKSGKWQAGVYHPSGDRYYHTDPLKRVVEDWAKDLELQIRRGTFVDPNAGKVTLEDWWHKWLVGRTVERATASKNESHWRVHVKPAFGSWPLSAIQPSDVREWVARMGKRGVGGETKATALRLLRQLLEAAVEDKVIRENPAAGVRAPTPPKHIDRFLDVEEAEALLAAITMPDRSGDAPPRGEKFPRVPDRVNRLFVKLMLDAGLRWQEAAGLHVFRVDLRRRQVKVQEVVERGPQGPRIKPKPKSPAGQRDVPLTDELVELLREHLRGRPDGLVFPGPGGRPLDYSNWRRRVWVPAVAAAGLADPQPTPHDSRHSYGSWLAENGVPPHEIMALMGHSSLQAVEIYIHASKARHERARQALYARTAHGVESQTDQAPSP